MKEIEKRIHVLEGGDFGPDGRDPELIFSLEEWAGMTGRAFNIESVPKGISCRTFWKKIMDSANGVFGNRATDLVEMNVRREKERRLKLAGDDTQRSLDASGPT